MKIFHKITKKLEFCLYFNFISLYFASIIAKIIIKWEKATTIAWNNQTMGELFQMRKILQGNINVRSTW